MRTKQCSRAFTLIELLVAIMIIGLLVALLLPAVQGVRESGRTTSCANNLHQLGVALGSYYSKVGKSPSAGAMLHGMGTYLENQETVYRCPSFMASMTGAVARSGKGMSYGANMCLHRMHSNDSHKIVCTDATTELLEYEGINLANWNDDVVPRHNGMINVLYFDGRVEPIMPSPINPYAPSTTDVVAEMWRPSLGSCSTCGGGLQGEYYTSQNWSGQSWTRIDANLDKPFGNMDFYGKPYSTPHPDSKTNTAAPIGSGKWTGQIRSDISGPITFWVCCDNEAFVKINGTEVVHRCTGGPGPVQEWQAADKPVTMNAGEWVDIEVRWFEYGVGSPSHLWVRWASVSKPVAEDIPSCNLRPMSYY